MHSATLSEDEVTFCETICNDRRIALVTHIDLHPAAGSGETNHHLFTGVVGCISVRISEAPGKISILNPVGRQVDLVRFIGSVGVEILDGYQVTAFGTDGERVVPRTASQDIQARTRVKLVVAGTAIDVIVTVAAEDLIIAATAGEDIVTLATINNIVTLVAEDTVRASAAIQFIRAGAAADSITILATAEDVVADAAQDRVGV